VQAKTVVFYQQIPSWDTILNKHQSLLFVGFGFNVVGGDLVGVRVKREGAWPIDGVTNRTISFSVPDKNTCHGDSGGPTFVETTQALLLAGVTSGGDDACTQGIETRIDAYSSWLNKRIK
jgi:secreted trypsin-like serine protease